MIGPDQEHATDRERVKSPAQQPEEQITEGHRGDCNGTRQLKSEARDLPARPEGWTERQYLDLDAALAEGRRFRREGPAPVTPDRSYLARLEYYVWLRERHDKEVPLDAEFNRVLDVYRLPTPKKTSTRVRASVAVPPAGS